MKPQSVRQEVGEYKEVSLVAEASAARKVAATRRGEVATTSATLGRKTQNRVQKDLAIRPVSTNSWTPKRESETDVQLTANCPIACEAAMMATTPP